MGYKYNGDNILRGTFTVNAPKPLDYRSVVDNLSGLYSLPKESAYQGMTVANISDGNIYMLIDKANMDSKLGWKASYESILIVACSEDEYKLWKQNTTQEFTPIDESLTYLHPDTYYYIYEDSIKDKDLFYVSSGSFTALQEDVQTKASDASLQELSRQVSEFKQLVLSDYVTNLHLVETYATIALLESSLSESLSNYYTKTETDDLFVTKASLRGGLEEGEDNFVFVTQTEYSKDKTEIWTELDKTIKTDGNGSLDSITVNTITTSELKSPIIEGEEQFTVSITKEGLSIGNDLLAKQSEIPVIITMSEEDYNNLSSEDLIENAYYYLFDTTPGKSYVTENYLKDTYETYIKNNILSNYYDAKTIDKKLLEVQPGGDYITNEFIVNYYRKEEVNSLFTTKEYSEATYATKESLSELNNNINDKFVTKDMLKGFESEDLDYIFVTKKEYDDNNIAIHNEFETNNLTTNVASISYLNILKFEEKEIDLVNPETGETLTVTESELVSNAILTSENDKLLLNGSEIALSKEIPNIITLEQSEYDNLIESEQLEKDTYYYIYQDSDLDSMITKQTLEENYYKKSYINDRYYTRSEVQSIVDKIEKDFREAFVEELVKLTDRINRLEEMSAWLDIGKLDLMSIK